MFVLGAASSGLTISEQSVFANTLYAALVNWIGLTLFVFSAAPVSGGHLKYAPHSVLWVIKHWLMLDPV